MEPPDSATVILPFQVSTPEEMAEVPIEHTKEDLATRFSQYPSVPTCYRVIMAGILCLGFLQPRNWAALPYMIQYFGYLVTLVYSLLGLMAVLPDSPFPPLSLPLHFTWLSSVWSYLIGTVKPEENDVMSSLGQTCWETEVCDKYFWFVLLCGTKDCAVGHLFDNFHTAEM